LGVSHAIQGMVDSALLCDEKGTLRKEAYLHCLHEGRLVIAGSDRRGTIYGIYDLCEALGVSPWHFWADVPVKTKQEFVLPQGYQKMDYPSVEYRGIFINDEEELEAWVQNYMGEPTIGVKTYEKVFELLLRLKANYIWPAMHVNSFNLTPENGALAERMGIVVGTSHCDMLMRSNYREWKPWTEKKGYTNAVYDYSIEGRNREILKEYWRESVEQNRDYEVCYTLGMRGIHDSGFETRELEGRTEEEIRSAKIALLEKIIADQRAILRETLGHETMMTFVPYKEVLELYDNGLEVPEDMTLVWANDNYGYIRRYPSEKEKRRRGGNGIYYHNSYWAPPSMSCVFLCSIPLA
ncbi:MAG: glycosyl hydrolase 115 family protein, partial [Acetatifactor sp.]|nr:glycosyl hydrolase 115 family protein [Acetatifactor sp.]